MLFDDSQASALKQYLTKELEPLSDADPEVLSDYVFALLKSDSSPEELREKCNAELFDFLQGETLPFVSKLFNALDTKAYLDSNTSKRRRDINDTGREESKAIKPPSGPRAMVTPYGGGRRPRCRDYDEKGFCMRGDMCPYDHGTDHIIVDEHTHTGMVNGYAPPQGVVPEYDPTASSAFPVPMDGDQFGGRGRGRGRGRGDRGRGRGGRGGRGRGGSTTQHGHSMGGQNTSLIIENIPPTHLSDEAVGNFFSKFGPIQDIQVDPYAKTAIVKFESNPVAYAAYNSPEAIFDNRFVKVFWARMDIPQDQDMQMDGTSPHRREPLITPAEQARIDTAKAKEEEIKLRKQEKLKAMLEIQKQKELLIQRQIEEQKALMEKLSDKSLSAKDKEVIKAQLQRLAGPPATNAQDTNGDVAMSDSGSAPTNTTDDLRAKVEALKAEASAMGIDPTAMSQQSSYRGRGRGSFRSRPRGSQSWVRGRGTIGGGPRVFKLDNRTTQIAIGNVPADKQQALQEYLASFGQVDITSDEAGKILAKFGDRAVAEQAVAKGREIPNVGTVDIQWAAAPLAAASPSAFTPEATLTSDNAATDGTFAYEEEEDEEEQERSWKR